MVLLFAALLFSSADAKVVVREPACVREPAAVIDPKPYMSVWKYFGQQDFRKAHVMGLKFNEGKFAFDRIGGMETISRGQAACSLLTYQQSFSLAVMKDWGYLTQAEVDSQRDVEKTVTPNQVTFTEVSMLVPKTKTSDDGKQIPVVQHGKVLKKFREVTDPETMELKKSAMWMVGGQALDITGKVNLRNLPWQADPALSEAAGLVDRQKYPYIWEFGRAAQTDSRTIEYNMRTLAILAYQEWRRLGQVGGVKDGYVFMHALNKSRTRLFERVYGAERFPKDWANEDNCILVAKISTVLEKFKPHLISERVNKIVELSNGALTDLQALEVWDAHLTSLRNDLDVRIGGGNPKPLIVEDFSFQGYSTNMGLRLKSYGLTDQAVDALRRYLVPMTLKEGESPLYSDNAPLLEARRRMVSHNTLQLSNLSDVEARRNPSYVASIMRGTFDHYAQRITGANIATISVRTRSAAVARQLQALGAEKITYADNQGMVTNIFFLKLEQIRQLAMSEDIAISEGVWMAHRLLRHPAQF